jgi:ornithine carbamoyltransferase
MSGPDGAFSRGETVYDTTKVLERYCDAIVIRTFEQSMVEEIAEYARVPVVNALTDDHHPCQGLADLLTIREHFGRLPGVKLAYVGDGNNMAHTYLLGGALTGMTVAIATPSGYTSNEAITEQARAIAAQTGAKIVITHDPDEAVAGADVVITDTWASMGQEAEHAERLATFTPFRVDQRLMNQASDNAIFMHCLPAHRGDEVVDEVIDAACSVVFDEAENRLHAQKALLSLLLG